MLRRARARSAAAGLVLADAAAAAGLTPRSVEHVDDEGRVADADAFRARDGLRVPVAVTSLITERT